MTTLNCGVIGLGRWGTHLARVSRLLGHDVFVYDVEPDKMCQVLEKYGCFLSTKQNIMSSCDCVLIATPFHTHYWLVKEALESKRHVLCSKPLSHTYASAVRLCDLAKSKSLTLDGGFVFRHTDAFKALPEKIEDLTDISFHIENQDPPIFGIDILNDLGIHALDMAVQKYGMPRLRAGNDEIYSSYAKVRLYYGSKNIDIYAGYDCYKNSKVAYIRRAGHKQEILDFHENKEEPVIKMLKRFFDSIIQKKPYVEDMRAMQMIETISTRRETGI